MQINEKLLKQITETKYLTVENADRYRVILRIFYLHYEKLKYWLYQEDIYEEMIQHEYFKEYKIEQCQQDLLSLVEWRNLTTIQDTRKVSSIEEFKNKKFRYQLSEYSVEIERLVIRLENLLIEGASLEPTLLERIRNNMMKLPDVVHYNQEKAYGWWNDLNNDFIRLNQNYQDYIRDLNSVKAEEMMKTKEFLLFKDKLIEYLRTFVKGLQKHVGVIESCIREIKKEELRMFFQKIVAYEMSIPRLDVEVKEEMLLEKVMGRWESLEDWFLEGDGRSNEAGKLFDATNEIIRKITRYATRISELSSSGANRKEEYAKVASIFLKCRDIGEAHRLSAMVFGVGDLVHLKGEFGRSTDSYNSSVYDEQPEEIAIVPRIRNYREKTSRSEVKDCSKEKQELLKRTMEQIAKNREMIQRLIQNNRIDFASIPVIEPQVRETLLKWLSDALETKEKSAKTEEGQTYYVDLSKWEESCTIQCTDGSFTMPHMEIVFEGE